MKAYMRAATSAAPGCLSFAPCITSTAQSRFVCRWDGRVAIRPTGRRRAVQPLITRASFAGPGGYQPPGGVPNRGLRRIIRRPRDLQQLVDILSGGAAEDPEQFLQLLSAAPSGLLERRRAPLPPSVPQVPQPLADSDVALDADRYRRQLQQEQQAAAAAAFAARRRAAQQQQQRQRLGGFEREEKEEWDGEEERRRDALRAAMLENARRHMPRYDAPSLARLASALAAAGVRDPAICDAMVRQLVGEPPAREQPPRLQQQRHAGPEPRSLAELLDAFAAMRHRPTDDQLAQLLRLQQLQQQQQQQAASEAERLRKRQQQQLQAQEQAARQSRLPPRGMMAPGTADMSPNPNAGPAASPQQGASPVQGPTGSRMSPEDAARLLYALSRVGYSPDEATLGQLLDQLQPQRLQLQQPTAPSPAAAAASGVIPGKTLPHQQTRGQQPSPLPPPSRLPLSQQQQRMVGEVYESQTAPPTVPERLNQQQQQQQQTPITQQMFGDTEEKEEEDEIKEEEGGDTAETWDNEQQQRQEEEERLSFSLQRDAQAVASAVRALERMGRWDMARQLREDFRARVEEVQAARAAARRSVAMEAAAAQERRRQRELQAQHQRQVAAAVERQRAEELAEVQRRQRAEEQARALRAQLARRLRSANNWQEIRVLLVNYQDAADIDCLVAAAVRLAELLPVAVQAGGRGLGLRERAELGDLLEGLGTLVMQRLEGAGAGQTASLLTAVVRLRYLDERLLVGLLRRLRDCLPEADGGQLGRVLAALAACGVRPSAPWMESVLERCVELLEDTPPAELASLPVSLARLGAHPGCSWLGSYLDILQEREAYLNQAQVTDAVRAVAALDRPFLMAWRQAAAMQQQQRQQQARRQGEDAAGTSAAASSKASTAPPHQQERVEKPADALASVDETLLEADTGRLNPGQQPYPEKEVEAVLPPMHPMQQSMPQPVSSTTGSMAQERQMFAEPQMSGQSIELDVDAAEPLYEGRDAASASTSAAAMQDIANTSSSTPESTMAVPQPSRQLPGSYSVDGYYSPEPYDEYGNLYDDLGEDEAEEEDRTVVEDQADERGKAQLVDTREDLQEGDTGTINAMDGTEPTSASMPAAAAEPTAGPAKAASEKVLESKVADPHQELKEAAQGQNGPQPLPQLRPEDVAQARALRSVLLERYEAVTAYQQELEARQQRGETGVDASVIFAGQDAAAVARQLVMQEQLQRLRADFDNFRRRSSLEKEQATARAKADVLKPLLAIADNFERAATQIKPKTDGEQAVHETYQAIYTELRDLLKQQGLEEVGSEGEAFDPNCHEAVMREDRDDVADSTVTAVFQKGYRLGDLLVRPALVKVAYS